MRLSDFEYNLPENLIAQFPSEKRDNSRLMVLDRSKRSIEHRRFYEIVDYLEAGDALVLNKTKVIPARLHGNKAGTGSRVELLLLRELEKNRWECLVKPGRRARRGARLLFDENVACEILDLTRFGGRIVRFHIDEDIKNLLDRIGSTPLPPYIRRDDVPLDRERYQTVYASEIGSVAAPTAGLHFTNELLEKVEQRDVRTFYLTLHIGLGTFRPVKADDITKHPMDSEFFRINRETAEGINECRSNGKRVVAVGTSTARVLETVSDAVGKLCSGSGETALFIYPGYDFKMLQALLTNFHLAKSTLLMMVCAFAGRDFIFEAYEEAIKEEYRFYSYGDAMLIL